MNCPCCNCPLFVDYEIVEYPNAEVFRLVRLRARVLIECVIMNKKERKVMPNRKSFLAQLHREIAQVVLDKRRVGESCLSTADTLVERLNKDYIIKPKEERVRVG